MRQPRGTIALPVIIVLVIIAAALAGGSYWYAKSRETQNVNSVSTVNANRTTTNVKADNVINNKVNFPSSNMNANTVYGNGNIAVEVNENTNRAINLNTNTATASNANVSVAGWQSYKDAQYGYAVQYPQETDITHDESVIGPIDVVASTTLTPVNGEPLSIGVYCKRRSKSVPVGGIKRPV